MRKKVKNKLRKTVTSQSATSSDLTHDTAPLHIELRLDYKVKNNYDDYG